MTVQKISTLAELAAINAGDYILVSEDAGGGSYTSKKYDLSGLVAKAEKDADAIEGNLSIFDADGNSVDSGYKPADMFGAADAVQLNLDRHIGATDVLPTLDLQFPPNGGDERFFDFTRATIGTRVNAKGFIETLGSDEVRYDYHPVTGEYLGPLIEPQSTNLCLQSEDLSTTWLNVNSTDSSNAATAPDGNLTADEMVEDGTASTSHQIYQNITVTADTDYCISFFAKANTRSSIQLRWTDATGIASGYISREFNLTAGTAGPTVAASGGVVSDSGIEDYGDSWYRCWISGKFNTTDTDGRILFSLSNGTSVTYDGDGTSGLYLWGAQLEAGTHPTSYIPTTTGTVTRAADLMSISGTDFTDFYNQTEGTVVVEAEVSTLNATLAMMSISDGTNNEAINIYFNTSVAETFLQVRDASVTQASIGGATTPEGYYTIAGAYKADDFAVSIGGGVVSVDSSGNLPVVDRLKVGTLATGGTSISGHVKRLTYYPRRLSNTQLITLST